MVGCAESSHRSETVLDPTRTSPASAGLTADATRTPPLCAWILRDDPPFIKDNRGVKSTCQQDSYEM